MLTYDMQERGADCLYDHLYKCVRNDIESGSLTEDSRLPSKRGLARHLGVSVITVENAYRQLCAEGYVRSVARSGFFVNGLTVKNPRPALFSDSASVEPPLPQPDDNDPVLPRGVRLLADLTGKTVAEELFPYETWGKAVRWVLAAEDEQSLRRQTHPQGSLRLRCSLADHLRTYRGMDVSPGSIVVGAGAQYLTSMLVQLLGSDNAYAVETPGYRTLPSLYQRVSGHIERVAIDEEGISIGDLRLSGANVAHVMPGHHYPTGTVTSVARRYDLLRWATETPDRFIIEDDYDSEFRLEGRPIPSLQSLDKAGHVIYSNTFAKSLSPVFRMAYVVLPEALAARFRNHLGFYANTVSTVDQLTLAQFIEQGSYERHINRTRAHYRDIRAQFSDALEEEGLQSILKLHNEKAGLHAMLQVDFPIDDEEYSLACARRGVLLRAVDEQAESFAHCFLISYEGITRKNVSGVVEVLARAVVDAKLR